MPFVFNDASCFAYKVATFKSLSLFIYTPPLFAIASRFPATSTVKYPLGIPTFPLLDTKDISPVATSEAPVRLESCLILPSAKTPKLSASIRPLIFTSPAEVIKASPSAVIVPTFPSS